MHSPLRATPRKAPHCIVSDRSILLGGPTCMHRTMEDDFCISMHEGLCLVFVVVELGVWNLIADLLAAHSFGVLVHQVLLLLCVMHAYLCEKSQRVALSSLIYACRADVWACSAYLMKCPIVCHHHTLRQGHLWHVSPLHCASFCEKQRWGTSKRRTKKLCPIVLLHKNTAHENVGAFCCLLFKWSGFYISLSVSLLQATCN